MPEDNSQTPDYDLFIIGGGVNGCGIARDAAGRGLRVGLAEMGDLGSATSSSSTKLIHGGLRYLEFFEFRLVRESLAERERLLKAMPHIAWPMRFVLPIHPDMRFEKGTPTSRMLTLFMPWMRGRRPAWLIRLGLFLYDHLGGPKSLPGTARLDLQHGPEGVPLKEKFTTAFEYSDCWVQDARLVVLNARDAVEHGATILPRTRVTVADRTATYWTLTLEDTETGTTRLVTARALVNAAGPWVQEVLTGTLKTPTPATIRLVRGSHIVTRRLFDHDKCYFFQGADGRIIFAIPYEQEFTLIGTTEQAQSGADDPPECSEEEIAYLCAFASQYFRRPVTASDVVWTYSGVRPLYDDGAGSATAATRDYTLYVDDETAAPLLSVFGGKITTYRRLAEAVLEKLSGTFPQMAEPWTADVALPGGRFDVAVAENMIDALDRDYPFLPVGMAERLFRCYGTDARALLGSAAGIEDLGRCFGPGLYEAELCWLMTNEFARSAEDVIWRRTKLGLHMNADQVLALQQWMDAARTEPEGGQK